MSKSRIETMLIVFFDVRGFVHLEFVPQGQTINAALYLEVLKRLKRRVERVLPYIKEVFKPHHDNVPRHTTFVVTNFLTQNKTPVVPV